MKKEFIESLRFIKNYDQDIAQDILIKIEDLQDELDNAAIYLLEQHQLLYREQSYEELVQYLKVMTNLKQLSEELFEIQNCFNEEIELEIKHKPNDFELKDPVVKSSPSKYLSGEEIKQLKVSKSSETSCRDNNAYGVENFPKDKVPQRYSYIAANGIEFQGEVKGWNQLILKLCEQMLKVDSLKLNRMPNEPRFTNGYDGHNYFSFVHLSDTPAIKIPNSCIYVEADLEDNEAKKLIIEILKYYNSPITSLKLYA